VDADLSLSYISRETSNSRYTRHGTKKTLVKTEGAIKTLGTHDTDQRQTKQIAQHNTKTMSNTDYHSKDRSYIVSPLITQQTINYLTGKQYFQSRCHQLHLCCTIPSCLSVFMIIDSFSLGKICNFFCIIWQKYLLFKIWTFVLHFYSYPSVQKGQVNRHVYNLKVHLSQFGTLIYNRVIMFAVEQDIIHIVYTGYVLLAIVESHQILLTSSMYKSSHMHIRVITKLPNSE
jgi:hypothetical protein